jgi:hypothetical protein
MHKLLLLVRSTIVSMLIFSKSALLPYSRDHCTKSHAGGRHEVMQVLFLSAVCLPSLVWTI